APTESDVQIVYWDGDLVVVNKPSGITSVHHASERGRTMRRRQYQRTLEDYVNLILKKLSPRRAATPVRPVHRLDRDTSGLMVFARTKAAERALSAQFRAHTTERRYVAVVEGPAEDCTFQARLVRDRGDGRRGVSRDDRSGKSAVTHVRVIESLGKYALVECRLETGRTHQIRIHLADHGWPLCGEKVYRKPLGKPEIKDHSRAPRLALHAALLGFEHPRTGERLRFESAPPKDLADFLRSLRNPRRKRSE
ncbi:MAG: RluA family pseudouridine synthase, partial [Planctomycetales bacterium]|nr:RluA family pseudouridine synthase [Planctomycetales bacterium]